MKEEFTNATGYYICLSDEGIEFKHEKEHRFFPYGSMRKLKFNNILGQVEIAGYGDSESEYFTTNAKNKEAVKSLTLEAIKKNKSAAKRPASDLDNKGKKQKPPTKEEFEKQVAEGDYLKKKDYIGNVPVAFIIIVSLIIGVTFFIIGFSSSSPIISKLKLAGLDSTLDLNVKHTSLLLVTVPVSDSIPSSVTNFVSS